MFFVLIVATCILEVQPVIKLIGFFYCILTRKSVHLFFIPFEELSSLLYMQDADKKNQRLFCYRKKSYLAEKSHVYLPE